jgi:hypothetical protein
VTNGHWLLLCSLAQLHYLASRDQGRPSGLCRIFISRESIDIFSGPADSYRARLVDPGMRKSFHTASFLSEYGTLSMDCQLNVIQTPAAFIPAEENPVLNKEYIKFTSILLDKMRPARYIMLDAEHMLRENPIRMASLYGPQGSWTYNLTFLERVVPHFALHD